MSTTTTTTSSSNGTATTNTGSTTGSSSNTNNPKEKSPYPIELLKETFFNFVKIDDIEDNDTNNNNTNTNEHIYGYDNQMNHELSMLQIITATRILDYENYFNSCSCNQTESTNNKIELQNKITTILETYGPIVNLQTIIQNQYPAMTLAAEYKRASPSKGIFHSTKTIKEQGQIYSSAGAKIISVLTEQHWFHGTLNDLLSIRQSVTSTSLEQTSSSSSSSSSEQQQHTTSPTRSVGILRKDFIINEYMIDEAVAYGADSVLLIVAILNLTTLHRLIEYCRTTYQIEPLVEVHTNLELQVAIEANAIVIGINNRNLHTFHLDMSTTERISNHLQYLLSTTPNVENTPNKYQYTLCALSGMSTCYDVERYRNCNIQMCLIGESLMKSINPHAAIQSLCLHPNDFIQYTTTSTEATGSNTDNSTTLSASASASAYTRGTQIIKICGITNVNDAIVACQAGATMIGIIFVPNSKRCVSIEQGLAIVNAVRSFGERTDRLNFFTTIDNTSSTTTSTNNNNTIVNLIGSSRIIMQRLRGSDSGDNQQDGTSTTIRCPIVVGVFQNQSIDYINTIIQSVGIDVVQLHGNEGYTICNPTNFIIPIPVIRVIDIPVQVQTTNTTTTDNSTTDTDNNSTTTVDTILQNLTNDPFLILLDTSIKGTSNGGGTGITFDWNLVEQLQNRGLPVIVAGGLNPTNVSQCIKSIRPFGIDCSSGVEGGDISINTDNNNNNTNSICKNHTKLQSYIALAKQAIIDSNEGF